MSFHSRFVQPYLFAFCIFEISNDNAQLFYPSSHFLYDYEPQIFMVPISLTKFLNFSKNDLLKCLGPFAVRF